MPKNKHPILSKTLAVNHLQGTPNKHTTTPPPSERSDSRRTTPAGYFRGSAPKQLPVGAVFCFWARWAQKKRTESIA